jgi:hypothetical protein
LLTLLVARAGFANLGVFGMTWVNDNHDVQVHNQGRMLNAAKDAGMGDPGQGPTASPHSQ